MEPSIVPRQEFSKAGAVGITAWPPCIQPCWRQYTESGGAICGPLSDTVVLTCQETRKNSTCTTVEFESVKSEFLRLCEFSIDARSSTRNPIPASTRRSTISSMRSPTPTATKASASPRTGSSGLATGTKAGISAGIAIFVIVSVIAALLIWNRRRKRRSAQRLKVLPNHEEKYYEEQKAELQCTQGEEDQVNGPVVQKSELPDDGSRVMVAELDQHNGRPEMNELEGGRVLRQQEDKSEVKELECGKDTKQQDETTRVNEPHNTKSVRSEEEQRQHTPSGPAAVSSQSAHDTSTQAGPLPTASDLYPSTQTQPAENDEETDIQFQERRLRERRALIAEKERLALEKEQIAMEEEALRRRKAFTSPAEATMKGSRSR